MRIFTMLLIAFTGILIISCSSREVIDPLTPEDKMILGQDWEGANRWVWGYWKISIPSNHASVAVSPLREVNFHYNVKTLLEQNPCDNCIWTSNFKNNGDGTISIDVSIKHPYPYNKYYTGFDVRGIVCFPAHYFIENPYEPHDYNALYFPALEKGDPQLLNPDGYTGAFSPFRKYGSNPPLLRYIPDGDLGGTFDYDDYDEENSNWGKGQWPFIDYYSSEIRRHFDVNSTVTRTYHIALPPGPWEFGYSVDACWAKPINVPVHDVETDFPWNANTIYNPYKIESFISGPLVGSTPSIVTVRAYSHFPELLQFYASCELSPETITGTWATSYKPTIVDDKYVEFTFELVNKLGRPPGIYPILPYTWLIDEGYEWLVNNKGINEGFDPNSTSTTILWVEVAG